MKELNRKSIALITILFILVSCDLPTPNNPRDDPGFITWGDHPCASPTSNDMVYELDGDIYLWQFSSGDSILIVENGKFPSYSKDGEAIAFVRTDSIFLKILNSDIEVFLTHGNYPKWSNDGRKIALYLSQQQRSDFEAINTDSALCFSDSCIHYFDLYDFKLKSIGINPAPKNYNNQVMPNWYLEWGPLDTVLFFSTKYHLGFVSMETGSSTFKKIAHESFSVDDDNWINGPLSWSQTNGFLLYTIGNWSFDHGSNYLHFCDINLDRIGRLYDQYWGTWDATDQQIVCERDGYKGPWIYRHDLSEFTLD